MLIPIHIYAKWHSKNNSWFMGSKSSWGRDAKPSSSKSSFIIHLEYRDMYSAVLSQVFVIVAYKSLNHKKMIAPKKIIIAFSKNLGTKKMHTLIFWMVKSWKPYTYCSLPPFLLHIFYLLYIHVWKAQYLHIFYY